MRLYDLAVKLLESDNDEYVVNILCNFSHGGSPYVEISNRP